ncbi:44642_t:CDS:2 [Gigaspora margarita]|uniref:44642_t:CDS:1 n=1 Tax=Gigaspora margarita TaxID=4874 RepID=A0ABN7V1H1_GIGMA|nr:44642_t:CDS:2 [Gigaspora margarita]
MPNIKPQRRNISKINLPIINITTNENEECKSFGFKFNVPDFPIPLDIGIDGGFCNTGQIVGDLFVELNFFNDSLQLFCL